MSTTTPFSPEHVLGSETPGVLKLVNRLYALGKEISLSGDLSAAISECIEVLKTRIRRGEEDAMDFCMSALESFTIRELQEMNKAGVSWVLDVLFAVIECGIETARHQSAVLTQRVIRGDDLISLEFCIVEAGSLLGKISLHRDIDGSCKWVATTRLRDVEWGQPVGGAK